MMTTWLKRERTYFAQSVDESFKDIVADFFTNGQLLIPMMPFSPFIY